MGARSAIKADRPVGTAQIVLFIPSKDRVGKDIDQEYWVDAGLPFWVDSFEGLQRFRQVAACGEMMSEAASCYTNQRS